MAFDEKEDFRSDFNEEQRPGEVPKNQQKHDRGLCSGKTRIEEIGGQGLCMAGRAQSCIITKKLKKIMAVRALLHGHAFGAEGLLQICTAMHFLEILHGFASFNFQRL